MNTKSLIILVLSGLHVASCQSGLPKGGGPPPRKRGPPDYSTDLETELRENLFSGYSADQRPQKKVRVFVSLNLMSINYLDIKDQSLSTSVYFALDWTDERLRWADNENYTNIPFLFSNERQMWRPAVIIENSIDDIDVISRPQVPIRIKETGRVIWTPGGVYLTHCESVITYYPLDMQSCDIILSTWAYTANELTLLFAPEPIGPIGLAFFKEHGEWDLVKTEVHEETTKREAWSFSRLKFTLIIRRRPLFHMLNTLFPVVLMAFLTVVVFKLPPESGERIGLSLTILLAFAVYLTLISESIPQTSLSASLLSTYLAIILLLQTVAVILTVVVLDTYFTSVETPVPGWLQSIISCLHAATTCSCFRRKHSPSVTPEPDMEFSDVTTASRFGERKNEKKTNLDDSLPGYINTNQTRHRASLGQFQDTKQTEQFSRRSLVNDGWVSATSQDVSRAGIYTWKEVARVLDKTFLFMYLFAVCAITSVCMGIMFGHFSSGYS